MISSVNVVDKVNPEMIVQANGGHKVASVKPSGNRPSTVVPAVSRIGRVRRKMASSSAWSSDAPSLRRTSIRSINTMALFTTMPTSAIRPRMAVKPKD